MINECQRMDAYAQYTARPFLSSEYGDRGGCESAMAGAASHQPQRNSLHRETLKG